MKNHKLACKGLQNRLTGKKVAEPSAAPCLFASNTRLKLKLFLSKAHAEIVRSAARRILDVEAARGDVRERLFVLLWRAVLSGLR